MTETPTPTRARTRRAHRPTDDYDQLEPLFAQLVALAAGDPRRTALREALIKRSLPLAEHIARKYAGRGENFDDLLQTARVGLVAAVDRFDPEYGASFVSFAVPTIMGEVRRHFRDFTWAVRVPRRLKELQLKIGPTVDLLFQRLGRMPKAGEIAAELDADIVDVTQAMIASNGYQTSSFDGAAANDGAGASLSLLDTLGVEEPAFRTVEDVLAVRPLIAALPEREREVLFMRFFAAQRQAQIAARLGISQMQVSRILAQTLNSVREKALRD
ncbi:SigB/SigF/SigG family RNA polymerase sigma factor [Nocardia brasiliensis]|uniref:SigB/SigF/SigG family RNA polymerase sigma factor n=1 Tax=Nocardia brasiliensis TaxID=37326 RepID=UPI00366D0EE2